MTTLLYHIPSEGLEKAYQSIKQRLSGHDQIIFDSMAEVTRGSSSEFISVSDPELYADKYQEIERLIGYRFTLNGIITTTNLLAEIYRQVVAGRAHGISPDELLSMLCFDTDKDFKIALTDDLFWTMRWEDIKLKTNKVDYKAVVVVKIHKREWGEIVPSYVVEYLNNAIYAYTKGLSSAAVALLSITMEATLRDMLYTRGYTFQTGASGQDVYAYTPANIDVDLSRNCYTVTFLSSTPKSPSDFYASVQGHVPFAVEIRRKISSNRIDLVVKADPALIDHWSVDTIAQKAQKTIGGLGDALSIARTVENMVAPADLPVDIDKVLQIVRNNLVHLSGQALNQRLPQYDYRKSGGMFTLHDFLESSEMVFDLLTNVPQFVNEQYVRLRQNGHRAH